MLKLSSALTRKFVYSTATLLFCQASTIEYIYRDIFAEHCNIFERVCSTREQLFMYHER
jgi:hypothetical protein